MQWFETSWFTVMGFKVDSLGHICKHNSDSKVILLGVGHIYATYICFCLAFQRGSSSGSRGPSKAYRTQYRSCLRALHILSELMPLSDIFICSSYERNADPKLYSVHCLWLCYLSDHH